jgi:hypothetical protein
MLSRGPSIKWWAVVICALLIGDLLWRYADLKRHQRSSAAAARFVVDKIEGREGNAVRISEGGKPIWVECDFDKDGRPDAVEFYFQGREVLTLSIKDGSALRGRSLTSMPLRLFVELM